MTDLPTKLVRIDPLRLHLERKGKMGLCIRGESQGTFSEVR